MARGNSQGWSRQYLFTNIIENNKFSRDEIIFGSGSRSFVFFFFFLSDFFLSIRWVTEGPIIKRNEEWSNRLIYKRVLNFVLSQAQFHSLPCAFEFSRLSLTNNDLSLSLIHPPDLVSSPKNVVLLFEKTKQERRRGEEKKKKERKRKKNTREITNARSV